MAVNPVQLPVTGRIHDLQSIGMARYATQPKAMHNTRMQNPDLEHLVTVTMPFGKYKGRLIADLPGPYLNWLAREGFPRGEIGRQLALMHEIDHNGLRGLLEPLRKRG
ncbi:hypothetical protein LMG29660_02675 [Burkholderia puraquae]|uniref:Cytoplasmic protein n=2 Tax=Burkholderia puraquae TaxID=1904757 RepID=A0A6J5DR62_9BURK|nr:hypothetical protein LMG29660_02675 [Burkholderia puraquae]